MLAVAPEDEKEIKRFVRAVKTVQGFEGIGGENHDEKISFFDMMRYAPRLIRYYQTLDGRTREAIQSPAIRCFLTSFFHRSVHVACRDIRVSRISAATTAAYRKEVRARWRRE
jgi:hypothetical protein